MPFSCHGILQKSPTDCQDKKIRKEVAEEVAQEAAEVVAEVIEEA